MSNGALSPPEQRQLVSVRSRQWIVNDVRPSTLPPPAVKHAFSGPQHLIALSSVGDHGLGEGLQAIWEIEPRARVVEKVALPDPNGFDAPDKLDATRLGAATTADRKSVQAPFRSGIDIEDYQLDPAVPLEEPSPELPVVREPIPADKLGLPQGEPAANEVVALERWFVSFHAGYCALADRLRHQARGETDSGLADLFGGVVNLLCG